MHQFKLVFEGPAIQHSHLVEFDAPNVGTALAITANLVKDPTAEMWCDGRLLCKLSRAGEREAPFWQIG